MFFIVFLLFFSSSSIFAQQEFWFVFRPADFDEFQIHLFDLISNGNSSRNFSVSLANFRRVVVLVESNSTSELRVDRADLIRNYENQLVFFVVKENLRFETFVNCKKIDSIFSPIDATMFSYANLNGKVQVERLSSSNRTALSEFFASKRCKTSNDDFSSSSSILTEKMSNFIEKLQNKSSTSSRLTIVFRPNFSSTIFENPSANFRVVFHRNESLVEVNFFKENSFLFVGKSAERVDALKNENLFFIDLTSTSVTSFVNCEKTDREFFVEPIDEKIFHRPTEAIFDRRSTLIFVDENLEKLAEKFFCSTFDRKHSEILPEKLQLRKFSKNLDIFLKNFDAIFSDEKKPNVSLIEVQPIDGFGSLKSSSTIEEISSLNEQFCSTNDDCKFNESNLICQTNRCVCPPQQFWSSSRNRCFICQDFLLGRRCLTFSTHKSNWFDANQFCENFDEKQFQMRLASNFNRTEIEFIRNSFVQTINDDQIDYVYWIAAKKNVDRRTHWSQMKNFTSNNLPNIWCPKTHSNQIETTQNEDLCVTIAACGFDSDLCQRNYRYICEAI